MLTADRHVADAHADPIVAALRRSDFARLDATGEAYLDYTGSALYAERQLVAHFARLRDGVFGNPHSESAPSRAATAVIDDARRHVLRWLDASADEYTVCFTANASAAIRLVGDGWPFAADAPLVLSADNHNSMNGLRELARARGAPVHYLPLDAALRLDDPAARLTTIAAPARTGLLGFPAQSNFSGVRHPLSLVAHARSLGWAVLLDAASYLPTARLSLARVPADFVALSLYKVFGWPTGVGALVARHDALARLARPWFAGGTVAFASVQQATHLLRGGAEGFEDGTPNFLSLAAVGDGFAFLDDVTLPRVAAHASRLTRKLLGALAALHHADGAPMVRVHGPSTMDARGATVAISVLAPDGRPVPYARVERAARAAGVAVRGGCFCNPGVAEVAFGFRRGATERCLADAVARGFTIERFAECMGADVAVGAVRLSPGLATSDADVERAVEVLGAGC